MGVRKLLDGVNPDLVLSGVNNGQNIAEDIIYSGTVAGALEAASLGIPSIALSQAYGPVGHDEAFWECAETHAPDLIGKILAEGIPQNIVINVNFPACQPEDVRGVAVTVAGQARRANDHHRRACRRARQPVLLDFLYQGQSEPWNWHRPRSLGTKQHFRDAAQTRFHRRTFAQPLCAGIVLGQ